MKIKLYLFISLVSFIFLNCLIQIYAQDRPTLDIPTKIAEQRINKIPYGPPFLPGMPASTGYCADATWSKFYSFPVPAGTPLTYLDSLPGIFYGYAYANGSLWGVLIPNTLVSIFDSVSMQISGVDPGYTITCLTYKQPNGPMYLGATTYTASNLYIVSLSTGAAVLVGAVTNCPQLMTLAMNCLGDLYGIDIVNDNLIKINPETGAGTIIGPIGYDAFIAQGGVFELSTGILYLAAYNANPGRAEFRKANLLTGGTTLITTWSGHVMTALGILAPCPPVCDMKAGPFISLPFAIQIGVPCNIKAKITNIGTETQKNIPVKFFVNGVQYGSTQTIPILAPDAFDTNTVFSWTPTANGNASLKICAALGCDTSRANDTVSTNVIVGIAVLFCDDFTNGSGNWSIVMNGGNCPWFISDRTRPYQMPNTAVYKVLAADVDLCGSGSSINSTATLINPLNCSSVDSVYVEFDNDFYILGADQAILDVSTNGGTNWINKFIWTTNHRNTHEHIMLPEANGKPNVKIRLTAIEPGWDWWWAVDNVCVKGSIVNGLVENHNNIPLRYALSQNYPNPFNPTTVISYMLPKSGNVKLVVFDVLGREVQTLVNEYKPSGIYEVTFDGSSISSGLYFYRINSGDFSDVKKMMLVK